MPLDLLTFMLFTSVAPNGNISAEGECKGERSSVIHCSVYSAGILTTQFERLKDILQAGFVSRDPVVL